MLKQRTRKMNIKAQREEDRILRTARMGSKEKFKKGPSFGPGPLPIQAYNALTQPLRSTSFLYDTNGRKHHVSTSEELAEESALSTALTKVQRAAEKATNKGHDFFTPFREVDANRSGILSRRDFTDAVFKMGALLTEDQMQALLYHCDPNRRDGIDYCEVEYT